MQISEGSREEREWEREQGKSTDLKLKNGNQSIDCAQMSANRIEIVFKRLNFGTSQSKCFWNKKRGGVDLKQKKRKYIFDNQQIWNKKRSHAFWMRGRLKSRSRSTENG